MRKIIIHIEDESISDLEALGLVKNVVVSGRISKTKKWMQYCFLATFGSGGKFVQSMPKHTGLTDTFRVGINNFNQNGKYKKNG